MKILFTFPGQGNQRPDMLAALPDRQNILAEARTVLGDEVDHLDTAASQAQPGRGSCSVRE